GGWTLQQIQRSMYNGLPARIHAHAPLFADSLTTDDGLWPIQSASSDNAAYGFADGAYRISGGGGWATVNRTFGDVAVEVTVRQRWTDPNVHMSDLGQIGLTLRATGNLKSAVTFTIGPLGDWALLRFRDWGTDAGQWQVLAAGLHNSAVHWGFQNNRLLVLMRSGEYVCFVNDHLVAIAHDDALPAGKVGFWLDDKTTDGYFSNFAVYPAV
ncbi:MAG TPA: hypothetical protein VGR57_17585, partial [Ktedonobacterales bacterium]|nr:hypothetical protein [Ktedonobacterales bacterium]